MTRDHRPRPAGPAPALDWRAAFVLMPLVLLWAAPVGAAIHAADMPWPAEGALVEVACFALPPLVVAALAGAPRAALGLVPPTGRALVGAALLGTTFWYVNLVLLAPLLSGWESESDAVLAEALADPQPLALKLLVLAVVPAVCEELLVRGAIARGLAPRFGAVAAVAISSAYFGFLHLSPARALPAAALGAVLGLAAIRSGSVVPAVLAHGLNNATAVALTQLDEASGVVWFLSRPAFALPPAVLGTFVGLAILWRSQPSGGATVSDATSL